MSEAKKFEMSCEDGSMTWMKHVPQLVLASACRGDTLRKERDLDVRT